MSRRLQMIAGAVLAIVLLWLFLREADLSVVLIELSGADYRLITVVAVLTILLTVHRAWRWHYLLLPIKSVPLGPLTTATFLGYALNTVLPGRVGEIARPVYLGQRQGISKTAAFATIVLERLFDLLTVLLILVSYLLFFPLPAGLDSDGQTVIAAMRFSGLAALGFLVLAVGFMAGAQLAPRRADALLVVVMGWLPSRLGDKLLPIARSFLEGFAGIKDPKLIAIITGHSLLIWGNILVSYYLLLLAFDIDLPFYATMPLIAIVVVGVMVPTPAAVGAFHTAVLIALVTLWGVSNDKAVSYAIVCHAIVFVPLTLIGIALVMREGLSLRGFAASEEG